MNYTKRLIFYIFLAVSVLSVTSYSQLKEKKGIFAGLSGDLSVNGYIDTYIAYDNDKSGSLRQFSAIAPYRDEFRINLAMIALRYTNNKVRGNVAVHFGDIPKINWPTAPNDYLQYLQEANLGFSPSKNVWLDAGYFLTHIGAEGLIPKYNFFQSFALCTYFEPLYQSGIRLSYTGKKFYGSLFLLNGYNVFTDNNKNKSFGLQLGYKPNDKAEFTYNNIIGNEMPAGADAKLRIYNNLIIKLFPAKKLEIVICSDYCMQENSKLTDSTAYGNLFSAFASLRYHFSKKFSAAVRGEIFQDKDGILSGIYPATTPSGLKANGVTAAIEYNPIDNSYFRLESRILNTDKEQKIFNDGTSVQNSRVEVILSGGIEF